MPLHCFFYALLLKLLHRLWFLFWICFWRVCSWERRLTRRYYDYWLKHYQDQLVIISAAPMDQMLPTMLHNRSKSSLQLVSSIFHHFPYPISHHLSIPLPTSSLSSRQRHHHPNQSHPHPHDPPHTSVIHPRTPARRSRHAGINRHLRRRVVHAPCHAVRRRVRLLADENCNARHAIAVLGGIQESQMAGAVLAVGGEGEGVRGDGGTGGRD